MEVDGPSKAEVTRGEADLDLETLANAYRGRTRATRLIQIAKVHPPFAVPALHLALEHIPKATLDVPLYEATFLEYRQAQGTSSSTAPASYNLDRAWIDKSRKEAKSGLDKLEVELKGYTTNLIKESIRMGHRDLARFQYQTGDLQGSIRSHTKSREFCTTSSHILEMCLGVIDVALEAGNYSLLRNYIIKAESALESLSNAGTSGAGAQGGNKPAPAVALPGMVAPQQDPLEAAKDRERAVVAERLNIVNGVAYLGLGDFSKAARCFVRVGKVIAETGQEHLVPSADIALYATLLGLATFTRAEVKRLLLENGDLRAMLDLEPFLRDALQAFYSSKFKEGLGILENHWVRFSIDPHLRTFLPQLFNLIRAKSLVTYFAPYSTVSLAKFALAFGANEETHRHEVVSLIQKGDLPARMDMAQGLLVKKDKTVRAEGFRRALEEGDAIGRKNTAAVLRMKLIKQDVVVKPPKGQRGDA